jgi:hypothetical protein
MSTGIDVCTVEKEKSTNVGVCDSVLTRVSAEKESATVGVCNGGSVGSVDACDRVLTSDSAVSELTTVSGCNQGSEGSAVGDSADMCDTCDSVVTTTVSAVRDSTVRDSTVRDPIGSARVSLSDSVDKCDTCVIADSCVTCDSVVATGASKVWDSTVRDSTVRDSTDSDAGVGPLSFLKGGEIRSGLDVIARSRFTVSGRVQCCWLKVRGGTSNAHFMRFNEPA